MLSKQQRRNQRHKAIRARLFGTAQRPRLCVFRSNKHIYCQLIDDQTAKTIAAVSNQDLKSSKLTHDRIAISYQAGQLIAKKALEKGVKKVVFDRRGYKYHGRVKAVAEGARKGGLKF